MFASPDEVRAAYDHGEVQLQAKVVCRIDGVRKETTVGRVLLWDIVPRSVGFDAINKVLDKKQLGNLIDLCYRLTGEKETVLLADRIRILGYTNATKAGISIALKDMIIPPKKQEFLDYARKEVGRDREPVPRGSHHRRRALQQGHRHLGGGHREGRRAR